MDSNRGRYVRIRLVLMNNYHDFETNNVDEYNSVLMKTIESPNNIRFGTLAIKLELHVFGYITSQFKHMRFKFNYDIIRPDDVIYDIGLRDPWKSYTVWFYAPHFSYIMMVAALKEHQKKEEEKYQKEIDILLNNECFKCKCEQEDLCT